MSFSGENLLTNLNHFKQQVGRKIKATKNYYLWEFNLNGIYHRIELYHSLVSKNIRVLLDGQIQEKDFMYVFEIDNVPIEITKRSKEDFVLYIGERTFDEMFKEEKSGMNRDLVNKKIEDLRKNNGNIDFNINRNEKIKYNKNIDINLDEDDDYIINENKQVNKLRDDDDFYKSNGNNLDFSDDVFEKNKKILENIDFFEDNDNSINAFDNNNNYSNDNNFNNNNFNFQNKTNDYNNNFNNYFNQENNFVNKYPNINQSNSQYNQNYNDQFFNNIQSNKNSTNQYQYNNNFIQNKTYVINNQSQSNNYMNNFNDKNQFQGNMSKINMINDFDLFSSFN
jgi:hypothetical protein